MPNSGRLFNRQTSGLLSRAGAPGHPWRRPPAALSWTTARSVPPRRGPSRVVSRRLSRGLSRRRPPGGGGPSPYRRTAGGGRPRRLSSPPLGRDRRGRHANSCPWWTGQWSSAATAGLPLLGGVRAAPGAAAARGSAPALGPARGVHRLTVAHLPGHEPEEDAPPGGARPPGTGTRPRGETSPAWGPAAGLVAVVLAPNEALVPAFQRGGLGPRDLQRWCQRRIEPPAFSPKSR